MSKAQAKKPQQRAADSDYESYSESNQHLFKRSKRSYAKKGEDTSKYDKVWCRECKDYAVTKKYLKQHVMTKHSQEYLKHPNMSLSYWMSYEGYKATQGGNSSGQSKGDDSDIELQEVAPKRTKTAEQHLDEQPEQRFEEMLTAKIKA